MAILGQIRSRSIFLIIVIGLALFAFVISGVFNRFSRDELKDLIDMHGGKVTGSLSSKTNYLVAGANMGPSKKIKAEQLNISILDEDAFSEMISP